MVALVLVAAVAWHYLEHPPGPFGPFHPTLINARRQQLGV